MAARAKRTVRARPVTAPAPTGAVMLVGQLEALGVEVVFGIPGVHNLAIFDALRRSSIRTVLVRHEQTAGYAADGYARATGRLGVCVTTTGPGAANVAAAMGEARAARSPVLHISTQVPSRQLEGRSGRFSLHESPEQRELMAAVTLWSASVARAEAIPTMIERAATEAFAGRRGPTFVEIPFDFLDAEISWQPRTPPPAKERAPDASSIRRAQDALRNAKRPVIWAGGGAVSADAADGVRALAEALGAPVVTTFAAKGILPPEHPLLVGLPPHEPAVTKLLSGSDAIVVIGSDLDAMNTQGWRLPLPRPRISINIVAEDARRNYAADVVIESDARVALDALVAAVQGTKPARGADRVERARAGSEPTAGSGLARARRFTEQLSRTAGDAVVVADMAIPGYWMAAYHRAPRVRAFAYPLGWGTLGFALPAAIGVASSGVPALVVAGDAGLMYAVGELATIVQERLPITLLVVNDEGYGMLRYDERERFGSEFAADLVTPDFVALAGSFGIRAERATPAKAPAAVRAALKRGEPSLIEVRARLEPPITTSPRWPLRGKPEARP